MVGGFGPDLCRNWVEDEILQFSNYELSGPAEGPCDQSFTTPAGTGVIENAFSAPVVFTFQDQSFDAEAGSLWSARKCIGSVSAAEAHVSAPRSECLGDSVWLSGSRLPPTIF